MSDTMSTGAAELSQKRRISLALGSLFYVLAFVFLYSRYVPQTRSVQLTLLSIILYIVVSTSCSIRVGTLSMIFLIPLTNSLPNFFHVPAFYPLLFFFYAYVFGILVHQILHPVPMNKKNPLVLPIIGASTVLVLSLLLNLWRYTNFFPLYLNGIQDFAVNVLNVTAGEAIRRVLFDFLNCIAGFIWFAILINIMKTEELIKKAILCLALSTSFSFLFGFIQAFGNRGLGNTEFWLDKNQINALFADPNGLGVYLTLVIPLFAGAYLTYGKAWKLLCALNVLAGIFLLPYSGSRSGFLGVAVVFVLFFIFSVKIVFELQKIRPRLFKRVLTIAAVSLLVFLVTLTVFFSTRESVLSQRIVQNLEDLTQPNSWVRILHGRQQFWVSSYHMVKEFPLSGIGIGTYTVELPNYYFKHAIVPIMTSAYYRNVQPTGVQVDTAGNYYIQIASELGIIGLFFYCWIVFLILKLVVFANFKQKLDSEGRFLKVGLSFGISALLIIFLFGVHTLNFEIQLTFWLCVGLLAAVSSDRSDEYKPGRKQKLAVGVIVVLFLFFHAWNTFHDLSLQSRTKKLRLEQTFGFYPPEHSEPIGEFRWSTQTSGKHVSVQNPILKIPILASHPDIRENPVKLEVSLTRNLFKDTTFLKELVLDRGEWQVVELDLEEHLGSDILLAFEVSRTWNPQKETGTHDPRNLGIAIGTMAFEDRPLSQETRLDFSPLSALSFKRIDWQGRWKEKLWQTGKCWVDVSLPAGMYQLRVWAKGQKANEEWPYMVVWVDDAMIGETWVDMNAFRPYSFPSTFKEGRHRISVAFMNDFYTQSTNEDRNLILGSLRIFGIE